jgi:predicted RNase H-like nuclease (RuvC/YqgF family)
MSDFYHNIEEDLALGMVRGDRVLRHIQHQSARIEELDGIIRHDRERIEELVSMVNSKDARIERLEAELIIAEQRGYANAMEAERKLHEERIEELEVKLAKAVEALDRIQDGSYGKLAAKARTTLAELKGETDA